MNIKNELHDFMAYCLDNGFVVKAGNNLNVEVMVNDYITNGRG